MTSSQSEVFVVPPGMPASVFRDKYARRKDDGEFQTWVERITEVVDGNVALAPHAEDQRDALLEHALRGLVPFSGRHVQHGDADQPGKSLELFSNCSTAMFSWASFLLLMKGCFDRGTLVKMADGIYKPIERIEAGEWVSSWDQKGKIEKAKRVLKTYRNRPKPMVRLTMEDGTEVVCTFDHLFLAEDDCWYRAIDCRGKHLRSQRGLRAAA